MLLIVVLCWLGVASSTGDLSTLTSFSPTTDLCHPSCDCLDTFFDCRRRELDHFPTNFPSWVQKLNMSWNSIETIRGPELASLKHLHTLSLDGNNLTRIPSSPQHLQQLTYLSLSRNAVTDVEGDRLSSFAALQELDISRNRISALINSSFPANSSIQILNLGGNQIESLEGGSLQGLVYLQELILTRNRIRWLAKELFSQTVNLEKLDLSRNRLEVMDSLRFQELKRLQQLNLRRNGMTNLSDAAFYGLDKLQHLYLDGNGIRMVERRWLYGLRSLRTLNLSGNHLERIEDNCWEYMDELHSLDLSYNKLTWLSKASVIGLNRLRHLDLSYNKISAIRQEAFLPLHNLEILDLSFNELSWPLEDTAAPFKGLVDCVTLNIAGNQLQILHPEALHGLTSLKNLNLSSNPLKFLSPETFLGFPSLSILIMDVQSFVCDCQATWLHSRLGTLQHFLSPPIGNGKGRSRHRDRESSVFPKNTNKKIKNSPQCGYPPYLEGKTLTELSLQELTCSDNFPTRAKFVLEPKTQIFLMEGNGSLSCHAQSHSNSPIALKWMKDYLPLPPHLESAVKNLERIVINGSVEVNSSLTLLNMTWADAGAYQCVAQNSLGIVYSAKANVTVHIYPSFVKRPSNVTVRLASNAKLECGAKGYPTPEIAFQKDGGENFPAALDRRFHVMPSDDSFIIMDVKLTDMGIYCCSARNQAGEIRACATVTVYETPSFTRGMEDQRVVEGSNTILECLGSGSPKPQIAWSKDNVLVHLGTEDSRVRLKENGSLLIVKDVQMSDAGRYECILSNAVGTTRNFLTLTVIPVGGSGLGHWSSPVMIIALVVVAALCVIATVAAWFVVICRDRRKSTAETNRRHSVLRYDEFNEHLATSNFSGSPPPYQLTTHNSSILCPDSGSQSSSGKDSGTGDDLPPELDTQGLVEAEQEALMRHTWRKPELETFSTFGGRGASTRLSQPRIELGAHCGSDVVDVISLAHPPGREFLTMPRKVPMPVPPPFIPSTVRDNLEISSGCSSSSGYSSLGVRGSSHRQSTGLNKERTESVNSHSDGTESLCGTTGMLSVSGTECMSSSDGLATVGGLNTEERTNSFSTAV